MALTFELHKYYRMKQFIIFIWLSRSLFSFGQITFNEVISFENRSYKEIQSILLLENTIIDEDVEYWYQPLLPCIPPVLGPDSCTWQCTMLSMNFDDIRSKYPLNPVVFKKSSNENYELLKTSKCLFGQDYNSVEKTAMTFIELKERDKSMSTNCRNELFQIEQKVNLTLQFSEPNHWQDFKSDIAKVASFQGTRKRYEDGPVEFKYGIRRYYSEDGYGQGVLIVLYGEGPTYFAEIYFDSLVD